jgi:hypothetical protein
MIEPWIPLTKLRNYHSHFHVYSAFFFAKASSNIEQEYGSANVVPFDRIAEHRANVTGAVFAATAFLEATINELFADAADEHPNNIWQLGFEVLTRLASLWEVEYFERYARLMEKFQTALKMAGKEQFNTGERHYQDVKLVIELRNTLTHYKPETTFSNSMDTNKLEKSLRGKFPINPLVPNEVPFFPDKCLGYGCAKWACESSLAFADEFFSRMGLTPVYTSVRSQLTTK